jgi:hypothetical protein
MKRLAMFVVAVGALFTTAFFQNCSKSMNPATYQLLSTSGEPETPNPEAPLWVVGDAFDYSQLPDSMKSPMVATQLADLSYSTYTGFKAVAIADNGQGAVREGQAPLTQADVDKLALDECFSITGGKPCSLIAHADVWQVGRNDLNNSFTHTLAKAASLASATVPFLNPADAAKLVTGYNNLSNPKAVAISLDGSYMYVGQSSARPVANLDEAKRLALERCEMVAKIVPCTLLAENSTVDLDPANINRTLAIDYTRTTLMPYIPGSTMANYTNGITNNYLVNGGATNGTIYISASGAGGFGYGAGNDGIASANCNSNTDSAHPCFKYATNKTLLPLASHLPSVASFGLDLTCKTVPRANCAAHKSLGCPAGQYYTVQAGAIALESCL